MKKTNEEKIIDLKKQKIKKNNLKKVFPYYMKHKGLFIVIILTILASGIIGIFEPIHAAKGWAYLAEGEFELAIKYMLIMLALGFVNILLRGLTGFLGTKMIVKM